MHIIQLSKREVHDLLTELQMADSKGASGLWSLRVVVEGDTAKFKVNEFCWSPSMGKLDPMCEEALRRKVVRESLNPEQEIVQDDQRAYGFTCDACGSVPGAKCTEATESGRKNVAYIHTSRINKLRETLEYSE